MIAISSGSPRIDSSLGRRLWRRNNKNFEDILKLSRHIKTEEHLPQDLSHEIVLPLHSLHKPNHEDTAYPVHPIFTIRRLSIKRTHSNSQTGLPLHDLHSQTKSKMKPERERDLNFTSRTAESGINNFLTSFSFNTTASKPTFQLIRRKLVKGLALTTKRLEVPRYRYIGMTDRRSASTWQVHSHQ